jgi:hypothetical protein
MGVKNKLTGLTVLSLGSLDQHFRMIIFICAASAMIVLSLFPAIAQAHPIEFHSKPLDSVTIERVIKSIDGLILEVETNGSVVSIDLPEGDVSVAAMMWSLQSAVLAVDESDTIDSPVLRQALFSAGYQESSYTVEEWQAEAQQVLETYEVIRRGLNNAKLQARFETFNKELPTLEPQRAIEIERSLILDAELLRTTAKDRPLVKKYEKQLQAMVARLGAAR